MRKRLLSLCLAICMVLGMLPVMAMAEQTDQITVTAGETAFEASYVGAGGEAGFGKNGDVYAVQIPEAMAVTIGNADAAAGSYTAANVSGSQLVSFREYPLELTAEELSKCILTDAEKAACTDVGIDLSLGSWACIILSDGEKQQYLFILLGDAGVMAVEETEIPVADNVIDITDKQIYKRTSNMYINAVNITVSGADVTGATEDGTTVNVKLDATTAMDETVSVTVGTSGKSCSYLSGNTGTLTLEDGAGTLNLSVKGGLTDSGNYYGTVNYTIHFKVDAELTEVPARLVERSSLEGYTGVAMEIGLKDYFKNASNYYLVEGETLTEINGKSYTFTPTEGGTHTLTFAAGNVVGMCPDYVTVTVEATELESGLWVLYETSSGSFNFIRFTDTAGEPIEGLTASIQGTAITVELPQSYDVNGKVQASFNLTQKDGTYPFLSTKTATSGTSGGRAESNKVSTMTTTLSGGKGGFTVYYFNTKPNGSNQVTFTVNYKIFNNIPAFAEGVTGTDEKTIKAVTDSYSLDLSQLFTDKDAQELTYKVSINDGAYEACDAGYSFSTELAGTYVLKFKANDGQDDSADTYTVTLTVENSDETYGVPVAVADSVEALTFHADSLNGQELTYAEGSVQVPLNVKNIWWKTADGMNGSAAVEKGTGLTLQKTTFVVKTALNEVDTGSKITVTDPDGNIVAGNGFVYLLDSGSGYTYKATSSISGWAANTLKDQTVTTELENTVEITLLVNAAKTITVDKGAELKVFYQSKYFVLSEVQPVFSTDNGDTVTYTYSCPNNQTYQMGYLYFAKKDNLIDKAGYLNSVSDTTITWAGESRTGAYRADYDRSEEFGSRGDDSVIVNVNNRNHLVLNQGASHRLRSWRIWEIINTDTFNVMIEPEYSYTRYGDDIFTLANVTDKISGTAGNNWVDLTATGSGVTFLEVGYEAVHIVDGYGSGEGAGGGSSGQPGNFTYNAADPARKALIVVQTDGNAASDVTFGIKNNNGGTWDAEFDTLYFTGDYGKLSFKPTAASGIASVAVSNNRGESFDTLTEDDSGIYTANIVSGANVIRITNGNGQTSYQVVRGDKISVTISNMTSGKNAADPILPGDSVSVTFDGLHAPLGKMSGVYNGNAHQITYTWNGEKVVMNDYAGYILPSYAHIEITVPAEAADSYTLTGGYIAFTSMGETFGTHRSMTDAGRGQNTVADKKHGNMSSLPDIEIPVVLPAYEVTLPENEGYTITACEGSENPVQQGGSFSFTVTVNDGYEGTPVVKAGETELTAVEGVYTIENITADQTVTVEGITKTVTYTVTLTEGEGYTITACEGSVSPVRQNHSFSFTVTVDTENYEGTPAVKVNGNELTSGENGIYTIENITADQTVTVEGIRKKTPESVTGDLDGDGEVKTADAVLVYAIANGKLANASEEQLAAADVNGDGEVKTADAVLLYAFANGKITSLPGKK